MHRLVVTSYVVRLPKAESSKYPNPDCAYCCNYVEYGLGPDIGLGTIDAAVKFTDRRLAQNFAEQRAREYFDFGKHGSFDVVSMKATYEET